MVHQEEADMIYKYSAILSLCRDLVSSRDAEIDFSEFYLPCEFRPCFFNLLAIHPLLQVP